MDEIEGLLKINKVKNFTLLMIPQESWAVKLVEMI